MNHDGCLPGNCHKRKKSPATREGSGAGAASQSLEPAVGGTSESVERAGDQQGQPQRYRRMTARQQKPRQ